ncbi:glycosyltransferase [Saccharospirillum mangrovi]|uniref:glycosyltransferase n=1 Tax=Saccharospirillum mangrovi TaxID=2161747 RepID=UPI000D3C046F|nr:glycosyltransferase family 2 protein [Saccharospirillum mangrovi]
MSRVQLSVVIPTYNEVDNIAALVQRLRQVLTDHHWEVIFVDDDSPDGTLAAIQALAADDARIRYIHRQGRRGLNSACKEGILAASGDCIAVMDADLQHDERVLPSMLAQAQQHDLVVASRYIGSGGVSDWSRFRLLISRAATWLSRVFVRHQLSDPMSGFFLMRRDFALRGVDQIDSDGFKILLELVAKAPSSTRVAEVPYVFRSRLAGESKLDSRVALQLLAFLLKHRFGQRFPFELCLYALVGGLGVSVHLGVLGGLHKIVGLDFRLAQALAILLAMTSNFYLNNWLTFANSQRRHASTLRALLSYGLVCSMGAGLSYLVSVFLYAHATPWWLASFSGILAGFFWNYQAARLWVWCRA